MELQRKDRDMIKLSTIKPNPNNPRLVKDDKFFKLVESIREFGKKMMPLRPMVVDENNILLGGNMRYKALKELKYIDVPNDWVKQAKDLTEEEKRQFIIKDNASFGLWDWDILANEWNSEELEKWGIDIPDFDDGVEIDAIDDNYEDADDIQVDVVAGDLIEFICIDGRIHRLICGDSTCSDTVYKLMDGKKASCILTDPPYEIDINYNNLLLFSENAHVFIFNNDRALIRQLVDSPFIFKKFFVFNHSGCAIPQEGGNECFLDHILISHEINGKPKVRYNKGDGLRTVIKGEYRRSTNHKHEKPFVLLSSLLKGYTKKNDIVLDFFSGGGSIFSASEQLNRICYGVELCPINCQKTINRIEILNPSIEIKINNKKYFKKNIEKVLF